MFLICFGQLDLVAQNNQDDSKAKSWKESEFSINRFVGKQ
jgi:hypothetical protein